MVGLGQVQVCRMKGLSEKRLAHITILNDQTTVRTHNYANLSLDLPQLVEVEADVYSSLLRAES
jgi:hypothetical protein